VAQIIRAKQLIETRNDENANLDKENKAKNCYGITNDIVVKVYLNKT